MKPTKEEMIINYLKYFKWRWINLYWNEYFIWEKLLLVLKRYKDNWWQWWIDIISEVLWCHKDSYEVCYMLYILEQINIIERWTSVRYHRIIDDKKGIVELLIKLLEKDLSIIKFNIEYGWYSLEYDEKDKWHIEFIYSLIQEND